MRLSDVLSFSCHTNCFWFHRTYVTLVVCALKYFQVVSVRISNRAPIPGMVPTHSCYLQTIVVAFVQKRIEASSTGFKPYHRQQTLFSPVWNRMVM